MQLRRTTTHTSSSSSSSRTTPTTPVAAAAAGAAATLSYDSLHNPYLQDSRAAASHPVAPLPAPPASSSSGWGVLPYLWELARAEKQMAWRMGVAFICMLMSKAAGEDCYDCGDDVILVHSTAQ